MCSKQMGKKHSNILYNPKHTVYDLRLLITFVSSSKKIIMTFINSFTS